MLGWNTSDSRCLCSTLAISTVIFATHIPNTTVDMLSPDMILEDIRYGEELEAKNENYKAYWVYMYAESAVDREDEAICLIGSQKDFAEAEGEANHHRRHVWQYLTDEEKEFARYGKNPFYTPPLDFQGLPKVIIPYNLGGYYIDYVHEDIEEEDGARKRPITKRETRRLILLFMLSLLLRPFFNNKWQ